MRSSAILFVTLLAVLSPRPGSQEPPVPPAPQEEPPQESQAPPDEEGGANGPGQEPVPAPEAPAGEKPVQESQDPPARGAGAQDGQEKEIQGPPPPPVEEAPPAEPRADPVPLVSPAPPVTPEPARPAHPAVAWPLTSEAIERHLRGIVEAHPSVASLESIGQSAGLRELWALRLGPREPEGGPEKPVLLVVDHQGAVSAGPEAMLEFAWQVAEELERDERMRLLFSRATLVLAPALDPDARAGAGGSPAAVRFDLNFPSGWQPDSLRPGSGRFPLSQRETMRVARYLSELKGCAVVLGFVPAAQRGGPYSGAELPEADREVFAKLAAALALEGASPLVPWYELGSPGGGLLDFAYQARGIYPLAFPLPAEDELASGGLAAFSAEVSARVLRCLTLLPRVELEQETLEKLTSDTWQLDVRVQNVGIVPTTSALVRKHEVSRDVFLRLDGAHLMASARKLPGEPEFMEADLSGRAPLSSGSLGGGEGHWLRLFLAADPGAQVRVTAASLRAGSDALSVTLP